MTKISERDPFPYNLQVELETISEFRIPHLQFLDETGKDLQTLPSFAQSPDELTSLYRSMVIQRTMDKKAVALQRTGRLGTYASGLGQEAVSVGLGTAMEPDDVLLPSYRDAGALVARGASLSSILQYWSGDERGLEYGGGCPNDFPITLTIGAQTTHSVGVAYGLKLRGEGQAAVCSIGEGATSKGDFYESINAAAVWQLPLIFLIANNHYAISLPASGQTRCSTFAQKAVAAGMPCLKIDGNDIFAVRYALESALNYSRQGEGPVLIEAETYRLHDHTTADDASRYREKSEVEAAWKREPIPRFRSFLKSREWWDDSMENELLQEARSRVDEAIEEYKNIQPIRPSTLMFDHLYAELPIALEPQRKIAEAQEDESDA